MGSPEPLYDPDEILARMRADRESDWTTRLMHDLADRPLLDEEALEAPNPCRTALSPSELRTLEAISRGLTVEMAGQLLCLSADTIKTQLKGARYRLRAKNTLQACCEAIRLGLIH